MLQKQKKTGVLLIAAACLVILSLLCSFSVLILEAEHDCDDDHCRICAVIRLCKTQIGTPGQPAAQRQYIRCFSTLRVRFLGQTAQKKLCATPVIYKIRLNN